PKAPETFLPQPSRRPSSLIANEYPEPVEATARQTPASNTWTGVFRLTVVPSPNSPSRFLPHAQAEPSDFTASEWYIDAAISFTPPVPTTWTGDNCFTEFPFPNWPKLF